MEQITRDLPGFQPPKPPPWQRKWFLFLLAVVALLLGSAIGAAGKSASVTTKTVPGPTVTQTIPGPTITATAAPAPTVTVTAQPKPAPTVTVTASSGAAAGSGSGGSTQISASGVYVVGQDIPSGTWHTSGDGGQTDNECYYARLAHSTDTNDVNNIIDNNNFDGPETVSLSGVYAFEISGPCTWYHEG